MTGSKWFRENVINHIREKFLVSGEETETFKYLGLQISHTVNGIEIHQKDSVKEIEAIEIDNPSQKDYVLLPDVTQQLRRIAGQLNWVSTQTRPDMAYAAGTVSGSVKDATVRDLIAANKFIKILKSRDVILSYPKVDNLCRSSLICFSDVSFANLKRSGSQGGLIIFLEGPDENYMPLAWQSRKLKRVVKSTLTAETLALQEAIELAIMIKCMLLDILKIEYNNKTLPIKCITDGKFLHDAVYSSKEVTEKRLKVELCAIRESLEKDEVTSVLWTNSKNQLADCLTKEGASRDKLYDALCEKIKLYSNS